MNISSDRNDVVSLLKTLKLYNNKAQEPYFNSKILDDFYAQKRNFCAVNIGSFDIKFGDILQLVEKDHAQKTLRTGHITNWKEIDKCNTGLLDYNNVVTRNKRFGILMLHDQTETDNTLLDSGDTIYLPASEIENGKRMLRSLFVWKMGRMQHCDPNKSYFLPSCYYNDSNERFLHLIKYLKDKNASLLNLEVNYKSNVVIDKIDDFVSFIKTYLNIIRETEDEFLIHNIFKKIVDYGIVENVVFEYKENKFLLNNIAYDETELIELILLPFRLASDTIQCEPYNVSQHTYPLIHNSLLLLFFALHYNFPFYKESTKHVFNVHFHWGAIGMAGYPPTRKGYFKTAVGTIKKFHAYLKAAQKETPNIFFVMLPIFPFLFYSDRNEGKDLELLSNLFINVRKASEGLTLEATESTVLEITHSWILENDDHLSIYFVSKFKNNRTILFDGEFMERKLESPAGLLELSYMQISFVVAALFDFFENYKNSI